MPDEIPATLRRTMARRDQALSYVAAIDRWALPRVWKTDPAAMGELIGEMMSLLGKQGPEAAREPVKTALHLA